MNYFIEGIKVGFLLIFLIGPIFFSLIHIGVEYGTKVGVFFGSGIWISDIFLFMGMYKGMSFISEIANASYFYYTVGGIGTLILIVFGLAALIQKGNQAINVPQPFIKEHSPRSLFGFFLKGVLINVFNPFTILFESSNCPDFAAQINKNNIPAEIIIPTINIKKRLSILTRLKKKFTDSTSHLDSLFNYYFVGALITPRNRPIQ